MLEDIFWVRLAHPVTVEQDGLVQEGSSTLPIGTVSAMQAVLSDEAAYLMEAVWLFRTVM